MTITMWKSIVFKFIFYYDVLIVLFFIALNLSYIVLNILSFFSIKRYINELRSVDLKKLFQSTFYKPISILVPAYNEEPTIAESVKSLLQLQYPEYEVVVINDGSTDNTINVLKKRYNLIPVPRSLSYQVGCKNIKRVFVSRDYSNLVVVDKENGGKADALNAGIDVSKYPLFCSIDADSILEKDCLLKMVRPFMQDSRTVAVGGIVRIANGCDISYGEVSRIALSKKNLVRFQVIEYLRAFLFGRVGLSVLNALLVISGAIGMFKKSVVIESGGYRTDTVGEDMELVVRLHRLMREKKEKYRITFVPDPVCWTEVPESIKILSRQRNRWQRGLIDSLLMNIRMLLNPRYGVVGIFAMPFFSIFEMITPIIEVTGYFMFAASLCLGIIDLSFSLLFLSAAIILGIVLSVNTLCLEELSFRRYPRLSDIITLFFYGIFENLGYRQLSAWWRLKGIIDYILGKKSWGKMQRKGFSRKKQDENSIVHIDAELEELTDDFLKNRKKDIKSLRKALDKDDYQNIRTLGHKMKGTGGAYGFDAVSDLGGSLEQAAEDRNSEEISKLIAELSAYLEQVKVIYE